MNKTATKLKKEIKEIKKEIKRTREAIKEMNKQTLEMKRKREKLEADKMRRVLPLLDSLNAAESYLEKTKTISQKDAVGGYRAIREQLCQVIRSLGGGKELEEYLKKKKHKEE